MRMYKKGIAAFIFCFLLPFGSRSQLSISEIKISELFASEVIRIVEPPFLVDPNQSFRDTVVLSFSITNDIGVDTTVMYMEGFNEWVELVAIPYNDSMETIHHVSGSNYYSEVPYDYFYYASQKLHVKAGTSYHCTLRYRGAGYVPASRSLKLLSPQGYADGLVVARRFYYTNHIITYFFIGAICFGFFFFFFLYMKSKYSLFGIYSLFLFMQVLYGIYQVDIYTTLGQLFIRRHYWDQFFGELVVFLGLALWVQFIQRWLDIKKSNNSAYRIFNAISLFFLLYAVGFALLYQINPHDPLLFYLLRGMRFVVLVIQLIVFYFLIFKIKSPVKSYVITGSLLLAFFGVAMVFMSNAGLFRHTFLDYVDDGSLYMTGLLAECICFSMGLGLRYFQIDQENLILHRENINVLQDKLKTEIEVRENEKKLADVNQELTNQQLTALRAQMNPHFIFNALNSIQKYIVKGDIDEANSYLSKFSRLQRMILSYCDENFISLDKEVDMLKLYLELEQLRLTHEFTFDITIDAGIEPEEIPIPPMILQPFAENAIWHGLLPKSGKKNLHIRFGLADQDILRCVVEDDGIGRQASQSIKEVKQVDKTINRSKGMSLVFNRLEILERKYGKEFSVRITDKTLERNGSFGTIVEVNIPIID